MSRKIFSVVMVALVMFASTAVLMPPQAAAQNNPVQKATNSVLIQAPATLNGVTGTVSGLLTVTAVNLVNGVLGATGSFVGSFTGGGTTTPINTTFSALLQNVSASCTILTLTLGPLHLDLLGLVVDLNQVVLTITAQPGPGNLLGNLLCSVANLLNSGGGLSTLLTQLQSLLNQILAAL